jgi:cytochrome c oxidase cbb3-type subunit 3
MSKEPEDEFLMDHEVDGIKELDNLLPRWWVWLFYITIIFSMGYMGYYHLFGAGDLQAAKYQKEAAEGERLKSQALTKFEATLGTLQPSDDPTVLSKGLAVYTQMCAPCHRADGGGQVGANLCDDYWIHGSNYVDTIRTILNGVPEKGMLTWRGVLRPPEIYAVASYIHGFRGTKPENPKPPENQQVSEKPNIYE